MHSGMEGSDIAFFCGLNLSCPHSKPKLLVVLSTLCMYILLQIDAVESNWCLEGQFNLCPLMLQFQQQQNNVAH